MVLEDLLAGVAVSHVAGSLETPVSGVSTDSRRVRPGDLFVCIRGFAADGHDFIPQALQAGAAAVMVEDPSRVPPGVVAVVAPKTREAVARVAANLYGHPTKRLRLVGVTGTNGKTTTAFLSRAVLSQLGGVGLVGTVKNIAGGRELPVERTTPEALELQRLFREMADAGDLSAVMEVSSHALALHRVDSCEFDAGVFTNLTRDHLDFHGDFLSYLSAKARLFEMLGESYWGAPKPWPKFAVLNADDPASAEMAQKCRVPVISYSVANPGAAMQRNGWGAGRGRDWEPDVRVLDVSLEPDGTRFRLESRYGNWVVRLRLLGYFNVYNALAAFCVGVGFGLPPEVVIRALESMPGVPGRFELVPNEGGLTVVVDYAHTPDGLENVLRAARAIARGRVIVVFGCGGDRDRTKRPIMGEIAARLADLSFLTSDNPRSEEPEAIIREVEAGARQVPGAVWRTVVDREEAIHRAVDEARQGDVVVIAGKGHETYQIFRDRVIPFDDRKVAEEALARRFGHF